MRNFSSTGSGITFFYVLKEKNNQPRILHPGIMHFRNEEEIKTFPDKGKQRISHKYIYPKRMAKGNSLGRKEAIREGILE